MKQQNPFQGYFFGYLLSKEPTKLPREEFILQSKEISYFKILSLNVEIQMWTTSKKTFK